LSGNDRGDHKVNSATTSPSIEGAGLQDHAPIGGDQGRTTEQALVDRITKSDRWMIFFTGVIAATGIISAVIFGWTLSVSHGQLTEMQNARQSSDKGSTEQLAEMKATRASTEKSMSDQLSVMRQQATTMQAQIAVMQADAETRKVTMRPALKHMFGIATEQDKKGVIQQWTITPTIQNSGPTEARNVRMWDAFDPVPVGIINSIDFSRINASAVASSAPIAIASSEPVYQISFVITKDMAEKAAKQDVILVGRGYIEWHDLFQPDLIHHMMWCNRFMFLIQNGQLQLTAPAVFRTECNHYD
jgi:hypothetical protein